MTFSIFRFRFFFLVQNCLFDVGLAEMLNLKLELRIRDNANILNKTGVFLPPPKISSTVNVRNPNVHISAFSSNSVV